MRRLLCLALLLAVASPAAAIDLGRLLPVPDITLPSWTAGDSPAPPPVDPAAPRADTSAGPASQSTQEPAAVPPAPTAPAAKASLRPRGWRSLLPGSIK